ncbi:conserved hypothetical protein [Vibrio rotiferianus]|uniref:hypothetical protein n=1 Tax=Vibrio rotiferianus TaxID=190895 RepID=UPI002894A58A|nr:conserved hypothetical protein [Vibrio rotiferianus]
MIILYVKSHVGTKLDARGHDLNGNFVSVPALLKNGEFKYDKYRGVIDAIECESFQRVKLVDFREYSLDGGKNWIKIESDQCVVGVRKWGEYYIMLFNGQPRLLSYEKQEPKRYYNNVHHIHQTQDTKN